MNKRVTQMFIDGGQMSIVEDDWRATGVSPDLPSWRGVTTFFVGEPLPPGKLGQAEVPIEDGGPVGPLPPGSLPGGRPSAVAERS